MSLANDLRAARALIDAPERWTKGVFCLDGKYCALGAALAVSIPGLPIELALSDAVPASFHNYGWHLRIVRIVRFNDAPATTHADIMALFDRAIAKAEAAS